MTTEFSPPGFARSRNDSLYDAVFADLHEHTTVRISVADAENGRLVSYGELKMRVDEFADLLLDRGVRPGDTVAVHCCIDSRMIVALHALLLIGATVAVIDPALSPDEIAVRLIDEGANYYAAADIFLPEALEAIDRAAIGYQALIPIDSADYRSRRRPRAKCVFTRLTDYPTAESGIVEYLPNDRQSRFYASADLLTDVHDLAASVDIDQFATVLTAAPHSQFRAMHSIADATLQRRGTLVTMPEFNFLELLGAIRNFRCSHVHVSPMVASSLAVDQLVDAFDLSCIEVVMISGGVVSFEVADALSARLGCRVIHHADRSLDAHSVP